MEDSTFHSPAVLAALFSFAFVTSVTPGPNNIMLATSGVNFGMRRTGPHMAGSTSSALRVIIPTGLGLETVFSHYRPIRQSREIVGVIYTMWLAWKIATADSLG